ncbi:MAG: hypothetical protein PHH28_16080 [Desulfuromonadaceae bacterium]|nr:hypothetical protein [Desulfuromonadaceae bacterium]
MAEPAAGDPGSGGTPPAATPPAATPAPSASVTFTADQLNEIDRITTERTTRASQAALKSYFQQQGMTEDQATEAIKVYKETNKSKLSPEAQAQIEAANTKATEALTQANTILIKADATVQSSALQIRADRIETVLSMADISKVKVTDGKVDSAAVKTALEAVLVKFPEWKSTTEPITNPVLPTNGGKATAGDDAALRKAMGLAPAK